MNIKKYYNNRILNRNPNIGRNNRNLIISLNHSALVKTPHRVGCEMVGFGSMGRNVYTICVMMSVFYDIS